MTTISTSYARADILDGSEPIRQYVIPLTGDANLWVAQVHRSAWTVDPNVGTEERWTPEEARRIAAVILDAADLAEQLNTEGAEL